MIRLGVNIDHVATVRQARLTVEPDPVAAATLAELGGADNITLHLREDRRHIQERDIRLVGASIQGHLNFEMAVNDDVLAIALDVAPQQACLVPEKREELTTEGGLDLSARPSEVRSAISKLQAVGTRVSLFIDPDEDSIKQAQDLGADAIELHTGTWANRWLAHHQRPTDENLVATEQALQALEKGAGLAAAIGLECHAGHGITYRNIGDILHLPLLTELNIGHSIISRALLVGMERAVADMKALITRGAT